MHCTAYTMNKKFRTTVTKPAQNFSRTVFACLLAGFATVTFAATGSASYTYDAVGRLIAVIYENGTGQTYSYDPAGNRRTSYSGTPAIVAVTPSVIAAEGSNVTLVLTRSGNNVPVSVQYQTVDGSAKAGINYTSASGTVDFSAAQSSQTLTISTLSDQRYDGTLGFSVNLNPASSNVVLQNTTTQITINDAELPPAFSIATASANEGSALTFKVSRNSSVAGQQSVSYATADATAYTGIDYTPSSGVLNFAPADHEKIFTVATFDRNLFQGTRTLTATLSNATGGAAIAVASATGAINDIDPAPAFSINSPGTVTQGQAIAFTVNKSGGATSGPVDIGYSTANGSAVAGTDFAGTAGILTFSASETVKSLTVSTQATRADSNIRTFNVVLSGVNGTAVSGSPGVGSIQAYPLPPAISLSPSAQATQVGLRNYQVSWTSAGNATRYELWSSANAGAAIYSGTALSYSGVIPTGSPQITVMARACNGNGCGAFSNNATVVYSPNDPGPGDPDPPPGCGNCRDP